MFRVAGEVDETIQPPLVHFMPAPDVLDATSYWYNTEQVLGFSRPLTPTDPSKPSWFLVLFVLVKFCVRLILWRRLSPSFPNLTTNRCDTKKHHEPVLPGCRLEFKRDIAYVWFARPTRFAACLTLFLNAHISTPNPWTPDALCSCFLWLFFFLSHRVGHCAAPRWQPFSRV